MGFALKSPPNQTAHLVACSAFNFAQPLFNFLLSGTSHQCWVALCLYKRHVPQLPAVAWPQKCHLGKNRLFSLTFSRLKGSGSQSHTVQFSLSLAHKLWRVIVIILLLVIKWRERHIHWEKVALAYVTFCNEKGERISHPLMHFRWKTLKARHLTKNDKHKLSCHY